MKLYFASWITILAGISWYTRLSRALLVFLVDTWTFKEGSLILPAAQRLGLDTEDHIVSPQVASSVLLIT